MKTKKKFSVFFLWFFCSPPSLNIPTFNNQKTNKKTNKAHQTSFALGLSFLNWKKKSDSRHEFHLELYCPPHHGEGFSLVPLLFYLLFSHAHTLPLYQNQKQKSAIHQKLSFHYFCSSHHQKVIPSLQFFVSTLSSFLIIVNWIKNRCCLELRRRCVRCMCYDTAEAPAHLLLPPSLCLFFLLVQSLHPHTVLFCLLPCSVFFFPPFVFVGETVFLVVFFCWFHA